jgi:hypothetical protein
MASPLPHPVVAPSRVLACLLALALPAAAFTPVLNLINPRGGQRGTELEINLHGERIEGLEEALFYDSGLALGPLETRAPGHLVGKLMIAPDARLGEHSIRFRGPNGITEVRSFWVGQFPSLDEVEPNNTFDQPQRVELNTTVHGVAGNEDEDIFICTLKKGQRLSVEVEAMRLGRVLFDPYVAILDPKRFELATCDDAPLLRNDAFASIIAPEDGDYRIVVREAAYEGNDSCQYRLHIGTFPRPSAVHPSGAKHGETVEFTFIGDPSGPIKQSITIPPDAAGRFPLYPVHDGLSAPSPHWITISPIEHVLETTGNNSLKTATPLPPIPSAAHGILDAGQDTDWYRFTAKKDQALVIRIIARANRSPLDSTLSIRDAKGANLANNDDQGGPDSTIAWTCPADGDYFLIVRDQLRNTGPDFTYRLEVLSRSQSITASLPTVERVNTQKWKTFSVPRGNRYAAVINLTRENIGCDALFEAGSLPPGITLHAPPIPRSINSFPVVFEAAPDATLGGGLHPFSIKATGDAPPLVGSLTDTIHHIDINNQGPFHSVSLDRIPTAVTTEAPFKIDIETPPVPIVKNGTLQLKVRATRNEGYAEKITLRFLWNPPGISGPATIDLPGDQSEITYELNAAADAPAADWQVCVLAEAGTPQGPVLISSALTPLRVAEPFLAMSLDLAATEQGLATAIVAKIDHQREFAGEATAELIGLPHGTKTTPIRFTKDQAEITFPIEVAADATIGKHTTLFCRVLIPENGATILHQTGMGGTLRIDKPAPAPQVAANAPAAAQETPPAAAPGPAEKPLSRLEQLRQKAK